MKRWSLILSAAVVCVLASGPARADYSIIKWTSGFCQVWDNASPMKPLPGDYKVVAKKIKTLDKAMAKKLSMVGKGCW